MAKPKITKVSQTLPVVDIDGRMSPQWLRVLNQLVDNDNLNVPSNPPTGHYPITNIYIDSATSELVVDYDDTPDA